MEDVEAAAAVPPVQAPPTIGADVAVVLRGVLMLAARGMLCGFLGAMWVSNAANIVWVVARRFGAGGSRAAAVAGDVFVVAAFAMILFCPSALLLLVLCLQGPLAEAGERERRHPGARHRQDCCYGPPTVLIYVLFSMIMLMVAFGFRLCDYGRVGCSAIVCFIFIPNLIAQLSALLR